ncbi:GNAT family N-acetyltransferase [Alkalicoccobacillus porphyridii]|uniref:GNAT family N-acetyltransferase n=1 Tax=Alkalicoccobacillus porphyridii TaxID=2597270 RepID=A0A554A1K9_9BACI|nr:GNAT family N-acetyltransferase [Alkalicoccobacillus porphyridii]TSB47578.1 GNAT family N-acetyltransferase [Alkalicoccobacillus porphyridii]
MIREAQSDDIQYLMSIVNHTIKIMAEEQNDQWNETYPLPEHFQKDIDNGTLFVKVTNNKVIGSITIDCDFSDAYNKFEWEQPLETTLIFHRLVVDPTIRKKGIASELIDYAEAYARSKGFKSIKVDTYSLNQKAQALFQRLDYLPVGNLTLPERAYPFFFYEKDIRVPIK